MLTFQDPTNEREKKLILRMRWTTRTNLHLRKSAVLDVTPGPFLQVKPGNVWIEKKKNNSPRPRHSHYNYHVRPNYQLMINLLHFHLIYHQTTTGVNNSYNRLTLLFDRNLMKTLRPREPDMSSRKPSATSNLHLTPMLPPTDQNADMTKQHQPHLTATSL